MKSINEQKHKVNWIDGMKINKAHFIEMEESLVSIANKAEKRSLTPVNYGLLPNFSDSTTSLEIKLSVDGMKTIEVELLSCRAITMSGVLIDIDADVKMQLEQSGHDLSLKYNIKEEETEWYVVISVDPYQRIPIGDANPKEEPPRHPFVLPKYEVDVVSSAEITDKQMGLHFMTIAKITVVEEVPAIDENYIPPCQSIQSHADLKFSFREIGSFLNQMESYCMRIIQKIHDKKNQNELAVKVLYISEQVLHYLNVAIPEYRMVDKYDPPIKMITRLVSLARLIKGSLDVYTGTGKENLINYLIDWCDLNQGAFENVLLDMSELDYSHGDVNQALVRVSMFTRLMLSLFKKLNELDYIGKKPDSNIFVKEEKVEDIDLKNRRSFFID